MPKFRVYIEQVNQTFVVVEAKNRDEAADKGYRKWREDEAHSCVCGVESLPPSTDTPTQEKK